MAWTERYVRADAAGGGDGTTDANSGANGAYTLAEANAITTPNGIRFNVKAGTYSLGAAITFSQSISADSAVWWRGFNSTPGDLDDELDYANLPFIDTESGSNRAISFNAANYWLSNLRFKGAVSTAAGGTQVSAAVFFWNCRFENHSAQYAVSTNGTGDRTIFYHCSASATERGISAITNAEIIVVGNYAEGRAAFRHDANGGLAFNIAGPNSDSPGGGFQMNAACCNVHCTSHDNGTAYGSFSAISSTSPFLVYGGLSSDSLGYGIIGDAATSTDNVSLWPMRTVFWNASSGKITEIYQSQEFFDTDASAQPMVDPANGDYSLNPNGDAIQAAGFEWLDLGIFDYSDAGAIQSRSIFSYFKQTSIYRSLIRIRNGILRIKG